MSTTSMKKMILNQIKSPFDKLKDNWELYKIDKFILSNVKCIYSHEGFNLYREGYW